MQVFADALHIRIGPTYSKYGMNILNIYFKIQSLWSIPDLWDQQVIMFFQLKLSSKTNSKWGGKFNSWKKK